MQNIDPLLNYFIIQRWAIFKKKKNLIKREV